MIPIILIHTVDNLIVNPLTGKIISKFTNKDLGSKDKDGYLRIKIKINNEWITVKSHRYIYEIYYGIKLKPENIINHINFIKSDNRIINLEVVTIKQNAQWKKSLDRGIYFNKNSEKWHARILINNKRVHLGYFLNKDEALLAYKNKAIESNNFNDTKFYTE
jgi:hypothetical protein